MLRLNKLLIFLLLISCGGGGGSRGSGANITTVSPCGTSCSASDFSSSSEYFNASNGGQNFLSAVNADDAYAILANNEKNWAGNGVTVAIVDTGVLASHSDLDNNFNSSSSSAGANVDSDGHGTHVAGIVAAEYNGSGMHGIAPGVEIASVNFVADSYTGDLSADVINTGATVINNSWGTVDDNGDTVDSALVNFEIEQIISSNQNIVMVFAAGNDSDTQPSYPARNADYDSDDPFDFNGQMLAVVATDNGSLASFSDSCGSINNCLAAPGTNIYSTTNNGGYGLNSGTSMSAPVVSGAAAILQSAWPSLTGAQVVTILLDTADSSGVFADSSVYGAGMLDLENAVTNQGISLSVSSTGESYQYDNTELNIPTSYQALFSSESVTDFLNQGVFYDKYGRDFKADYISKLEYYNDSRGLDFFFTDHYVEAENIGFNSNNFAFNFNNITDRKAEFIFENPETENQNVEFDNLFFSGNIAPKLAFNFSATSHQSNIVNQYDFLSNFNIANETAFNSYYDNNIDNSQNFALTYQASKNLALTSSFFRATNLASDDEYYGFSNALNKSFKKFAINFAHSFYHEENGVLGFTGSEGFVSADSAENHSFDIALTSKNPKFNYFIKYGYLLSEAEQQDSLITTSNNFTTSNFTLGAVYNLNTKEKLGFSVARPWQIEQGSVQLVISTGLTDDGRVITDSLTVDLGAIEFYDYEIFYYKHLGKNRELKFNLVTNQQRYLGNNDFEHAALLEYVAKF